MICLDNILAVAAVARECPALLIFGPLLSCLLSIPGGLLIAQLTKQYPLLVSVGAAVLGRTAGTLIAGALALFGDGFDGVVVQILLLLLMMTIVVTSPSWWPGTNHGDPVAAKPPLGQ